MTSAELRCWAPQGVPEIAAGDDLAAAVVAGDSDPYAAADRLIESL